ncbi:MAG: type II 3-dehydroquinate dehydratase [Oscillospiraceae bacterium]
MKNKILIVHGPNLNLLGEREPNVYGDQSYTALNTMIEDYTKSLGYDCEIFQSNHEGAIIDRLHQARLDCDGVVLNAGAYTHYSYAIRDAIATIKIPVIEVHISNVHAREDFRKNSVISPVCKGTIAGFGRDSYILGVMGLVRMLEGSKNE